MVVLHRRECSKLCWGLRLSLAGEKQASRIHPPPLLCPAPPYPGHVEGGERCWLQAQIFHWSPLLYLLFVDVCKRVILSVGERGYQILFVCSTIFGFEMHPKMAKSLNLKWQSWGYLFATVGGILHLWFIFLLQEDRCWTLGWPRGLFAMHYGRRVSHTSEYFSSGRNIWLMQVALRFCSRSRNNGVFMKLMLPQITNWWQMISVWLTANTW